MSAKARRILKIYWLGRLEWFSRVFLLGVKPRQQAGTFGETSYHQLCSWPASVYCLAGFCLAGFSRARFQSSPLPGGLAAVVEGLSSFARLDSRGRLSPHGRLFPPGVIYLARASISA